MIGVFDSGLGGLTILKSFLKVLPEYKFMYFGDTAHVPYGNRSQKMIYEFTRQGVDFLFEKKCEMVILACGTASSEALKKLQTEYLPKKYPDKRILGVIRPLAEKASELTRSGRIGVIGTRATVLSNAYVREVQRIKKQFQVFQNPAPLLVPLIEEGWMKSQEARKIAKYYLKPLKVKRVDTLILGSTHYTFLYSVIKNIMGKSCQTIESGPVVANSLQDYLQRHPELEKKIMRNQPHEFYVTDITENFQNIAHQWLGQSLTLNKVDVKI